MLVQVIAREIREHRRVKPQAGDSFLIQSMRRHLHRDARRTELRELAVQREDVGSRHTVRRDRGRHAVPQRADVAARPLRKAQHLREQVRDRRLAVRAGDADDRRFARRRVERTRKLAEARFQVRHGDARRRRLTAPRRRLVEHDRGAALECLARILEAVLASTRHREESRSRPHRTTVERETRDGETRVAARSGAKQVTERPIARGQRGHHGLTCACAATVSGGASSASGGTASTRSAPETMLAKTGAAMSLP